MAEIWCLARQFDVRMNEMRDDDSLPFTRSLGLNLLKEQNSLIAVGTVGCITILKEFGPARDGCVELSEIVVRFHTTRPSMRRPCMI